MHHGHYRISGVVQGVGFRPFCKILADALNLSGSVRNTGRGVEIHLFGSRKDIKHYMEELTRKAPPLAEIEKKELLLQEEVPQASFPEGFSILSSDPQNRGESFIPPDIATCKDCRRDLGTPGNPRYAYPFTNCTNCGPRFTIIRSLPYDRPNTSMDSFPLCSFCAEEYHDPGNRRYHAQPVACPNCGPLLYGSHSGGITFMEDRALDVAVEVLQKGGLEAIKGLGGFHLACDPGNETTLKRLRHHKRRRDKPFALMAANLDAAEELVLLGEKERELLASPQAPIVLCPLRKNAPISPLVAPGQSRLGIMLPYTPLHILLLKNFSSLVMTSANYSGDPLLTGNEEALKLLLEGHVDLVLWHLREIVHPLDDSVMAPWEKDFFFLRRARGYVPNPFFLKKKTPSICAAGSEMKGTFALSQNTTLLVSPYLGDLKNLGTHELYKKSLRHFLELFHYSPEYLAYDMHPQYLSTKAASEVLGISPYDPLRAFPVQHHHAHLASCLFEHSLEGPALGIILDGTGYGTDGTIWGGEFLLGDCASFSRQGSLRPFSLLGGDRAALEPWRSAASLLMESFSLQEARNYLLSLWPREKPFFDSMPSLLSASLLTTSTGRFLDGISALLTGKKESSYDGQAPMELEALARDPFAKEAPFVIYEQNDMLRVDWRPAVRWVMENKKFLSKESLATGIHKGLASALAETAKALCSTGGISKVALSGGVWQNRLLLDETWKKLEKYGLFPLAHRKIAPNDEGISVGQLVIAAKMLEKGAS
ncbi:MAG TPA: carbamoyltransferase HypF [Synergistaceae bacterium]|nr:carbamoyltransferase HypF [Synergistaceae bacterium]HPJ25439.1 carbamoyltransferase HypF [Synergistaceae bacterium]HPQ36702.1 carbamoyltransferase HypF [Synergistaceae bacterium]